MNNFYLIRHAQSEANLSGRYGTDAPLSEEGIRQAAVAARSLRRIHPDIVLTGTKTRQIQTAQIIFSSVYNHETDPVFDEIYFGDLEGSPITQEQNQEVTNNPVTIPLEHNGDNIWKRAKKAVERLLSLAQQYPERKIAIITGDTLMQAIVCYILYGEKNGYIWSTEAHLRNCECIKLVVNDNAVDANMNRHYQIDRLYINGKNLLKIPAWKHEKKKQTFNLI